MDIRVDLRTESFTGMRGMYRNWFTVPAEPALVPGTRGECYGVDDCA